MATKRRNISASLAVAGATAGLALTITVGAGAAGAATPSGVLSYHLSTNGSISGPANVPSGVLEFKAMGFKGHVLQIALPNKGATIAQTLKDAAQFNKTYKPGALERDVRFVGGVLVHSTMFVKLPAGTYWLIDTSMPNNHVKVIHASSSVVSNLATPPSTQIKAVHDMSFAKHPLSIPASGYLRFSNRSTDVHFIELDRMKAGKNLGDLTKAINGKVSPTSVLYMSGDKNTFAAGEVSQRWGETVSYSLTPGLYAVVCFWPDRNGVPHANMGMYRTIRVG